MTAITGTNIALQSGANTPTFTTDATAQGDTAFSNLFQQVQRTLISGDQEQVLDKQAIEIEQDAGEQSGNVTDERTFDIAESFTKSTEFANGDIELLEADTEGSFATTGKDSDIDVDTGIEANQTNDKRAQSTKTFSSFTDTTVTRKQDDQIITSNSRDVAKTKEEKFDDKFVSTDLSRSTNSTTVSQPKAEKPEQEQASPVKTEKSSPVAKEPATEKLTVAAPSKPSVEPEQDKNDFNQVYSFSSSSISSSSSSSSKRIILGQNSKTVESSGSEMKTVGSDDQKSGSSSTSSGISSISSTNAGKPESEINSLFQSLLAKYGF